MKNSYEIIRIRSCDHPVYNAVPQPLRHRVTPLIFSNKIKLNGGDWREYRNAYKPFKKPDNDGSDGNRTLKRF
jgi:hypothetical protein